MAATLSFPNPTSSDAAEGLRREVREFLAEQLEGCSPVARARSWSGYDAQFSRAVAARGWLGMTWPPEYGGRGRSMAERYVVIEEMLAAGAPVAAHWFADRQTGPLLLKFGTEEQKRTILPAIASGDCFTCIGMSEPDAGSDLAAIRTRAVPVEGGWTVNGTKLWTTHAQGSQLMILFCRTSGSSQDRQHGTSQLLVDLALPGITIRPIRDISGATHFNEVSFEDVFVPATALIGREGEGWTQVMSELAYERSGPERFLSSFTLLVELVRLLQEQRNPVAEQAVGRLVSHLIVLRHLSRAVATLLEEGADAQVQAAVVKDLGAVFEQEIPEIAQALVECELDLASERPFPSVLAHLVLNAPSFSLRGGTREILRGIIARSLGLR